jgi:hypothetical protein
MYPVDFNVDIIQYIFLFFFAYSFGIISCNYAHLDDAMQECSRRICIFFGTMYVFLQIVERACENCKISLSK